jgi:para-nitrobenzyl esterase
VKLAALFIVLLAAACAAPPPAGDALAGTSWRLARFAGGDGKVLVPDDPAKYTVAFAADGAVSVRFDCNRGRGGWKSARRNQLELGPMALTRAMCPPGSLHDQLVKHWPYIRSYTLKDGRLFLALMADGGVYEFTALPAP